MLGCEPLRREPIEGLYTDAITLVAEVIESRVKPSLPWGMIAETAFGAAGSVTNNGNVSQVICALGHMDTDPKGLTPPSGIEILGSSSDHLIMDSGEKRLSVGAEISFKLNYSAMIRAMASLFVVKRTKGKSVQEIPAVCSSGCAAALH